MEIDLNQFELVVKRIEEKAWSEGRLLSNPSDSVLKELTGKEPEAKETKYDNFVVESEPTSRAAMFTKNSIDYPFGEEELKLLAQAEKYLSREKLILIDRVVGNENSGISARLIVPERFAHVALGGGNLQIPTKGEIDSPTYQILMFFDEAFEKNKSNPLSQKDITIRLSHLDDGRMIKIIRNSNYIGEWKKGIFAGEDWRVKLKKKGIFLHAGCREDYLLSAKGEYQTVRSLIVALSANGKTTLTCRILARKGKEKSWVIQDDGGTLAPDGSFYGFEKGGIYAKTESVNPKEQIEIFYGLHKPDTLLENVYVDKEGDFDFYNLTRTSNGRAVIRRRDFLHASPYIDVGRIDNLILISRGSLLPAISKLTPEQAAFLMVDGRAMESSAGDPTQAGRIRSEFFYDPFVAGNRAEHANNFYEIIKGLPHLNCYLINTGGIGEGEQYKNISVGDTLAILDSLFRGGLGPEDWLSAPTGFQVPKAVRAVDDIYFHPEKLYSAGEFEERQKELNRMRWEAIEKVGSGLHQNIKKAFERH